jgi:carbon monoxide dehydrogenase subunit G
MGAIVLDERFSVDAPVASVWDFLIDPRCVVGCVPGGALGPILDDRTFDGAVRVAVGPFTLAYAGRVRLDEVDPASRRVRILGEARERAGAGAARLELVSSLRGPQAGPTEVEARMRLDVAGRIVKLGRGPLERLGHVVFQEFAAAVRAAIEEGEARRRPGLRAPPSPPLSRAEPHPAPPAFADAPAHASPPLRALPLVIRALRAWLEALFAARLRARRR